MTKHTRKKCRELAIACFLACILGGSVLMSGCALFLVGASAGAGAAGVAYVEGALEATMQADPRTIEAAADKALAALSIAKISSSSTAIDALVVGRTSTDTRVEITAKVLDAGGSKLKIRVGVFGDQPLSRKIHDEIVKQMPKR